MQQTQFVADNLGRMAFNAILAHPFACLQMAFDIHQRAFFQMLCGHLGQPFVKHDTMPFRRIPSGTG